MYTIVPFYNIAIAILNIFILLSIKLSFFLTFKSIDKVTEKFRYHLYDQERAIQKKTHKPILQKIRRGIMSENSCYRKVGRVIPNWGAIV